MEIRPILSTLLRSRTGPLLVALQVAISLAILANALFVVQQRIAVSQRPSGVVNERDVGYVFVRPLAQMSHVETLAQQQREREALKAVPGVLSVGWTSQMPMSRSGSSSSIRLSPEQARESATPAFYSVQPGFAATLGLRFVEGRDLNEADLLEYDPRTAGPDDGTPGVVVITLPLAKFLFPDATTYVGRNLWQGSEGRMKPMRIVGVVENLMSQGAGSLTGPYSVILPFRASLSFSRWAVRAEPGKLEQVLKDAEEAIRKAAPAPVRTFKRSVAEDRESRYRNERAMAWMLVSISALLLLVTLSGIVGMTMLRVAQRRKQIGVRRALGARWRDILRYFMVENFIITTGGIVAGLMLAVGLNRLLMAYTGMPRLPIEYMAYGAAALWVLGIAAVYGPASKAASISPAIATRTA
ncbi:MAG TPA: FtsX-like permease family protein [Usitatibacter sp.]|nr:FtsX-like permease family protein [Usitatibacter sp.]